MTITPKNIVLSLLVSLIIITGYNQLTVQKSSLPQTKTTADIFETKENSGGNVTVSVTPITLKPGFPASLDVAFETHSVELAFDVEQIAAMTDTAGKTYTPHWQGSPPGGHHRKGTLVFTPDIPKSTTITLIFRDIAGIPSRTFTWTL